MHPCLDAVEGFAHDEGGEVLGGPWADGNLGLLGPAVNVPGSEEAGDEFESQVEQVHQEPV